MPETSQKFGKIYALFHLESQPTTSASGATRQNSFPAALLTFSCLDQKPRGWFAKPWAAYIKKTQWLIYINIIN